MELNDAILKLINQTKFGSIEIHFKDKDIIWIDKHRRYSPEALINEMSLTELPIEPIL